MSVQDWADRKFDGDELVAHFVPYGDRLALCRKAPEWEWLGTGDMDEVDVAAALPLCLECRRITTKTQASTADPAVDAWTKAIEEMTA